MKNILSTILSSLIFFSSAFLFPRIPASCSMHDVEVPMVSMEDVINGVVTVDGQQAPQINIFEAIDQRNGTAILREAEAGRVHTLNGDNTALYHAVNSHAPLAYVEAIVDAGALVNVKCEEGRTALHAAAWRKRADVVKLLIEHGADTSILNNRGSTPFMLACRKDSIDAAKLLLSESNINLQNNDGNTALHAASFRAHYDVIEFLLEKGVDASVQNNKGDTAIDVVKLCRDDDKKQEALQVFEKFETKCLLKKGFIAMAVPAIVPIVAYLFFS